MEVINEQEVLSFVTMKGWTFLRIDHQVLLGQPTNSSVNILGKYQQDSRATKESRLWN